MGRYSLDIDVLDAEFRLLDAVRPTEHESVWRETFQERREFGRPLDGRRASRPTPASELVPSFQSE